MSIDSYRKLIESFKDNGYSRYVAEIRGFILQSLTGKECHLNLLPEDYIPTDLIRGKYFCKEIKAYLLQSPPYRNFAQEPTEIIQLKKMLNALYHTQIALEGFERLDISEKKLTHILAPVIYENFKQSGIMDHAYEASTLFTQLDPQFLSVFMPELDTLKKLVLLLKQQTDSVSEDTEEKIEQVKAHFTAYQAGRLAGIGIEQLSSNRRQIDFGFVATMFSKAPQYIDQLTQMIRHYSGELSEAERRIDDNEIKRLQEGAIKIIEGLDDLYNSNRLTMPFKVLRYIRMIREIIALAHSITNQVCYANDSTQEALANKMVHLKYDLLQQLFELTDKIEDYGMFTPGLISKPLMVHMEKMYGSLAYYVGNVVEFPKHGKDLARLNDSTFKQRRIAAIEKRLQTHKTKQLQCEKAKAVLEKFYQCIDAYPDTKIYSLEQTVRQDLEKEYRLIQPLMQAYDEVLHQRIVAAFAAEEPQGWVDWAKDKACSLVGRGCETTNWLQTLKPDLEKILSSQCASVDFREAIASSLIASINAQVVAVSPYRKAFKIACVDERALIKASTEVTDRKEQGSRLLCADEAFDSNAAINAENGYQLQERYRYQLDSLEKALCAYQDFKKSCAQADPYQWSSKKRHQLLEYYRVFQPWLYTKNDDIKDIDQAVLAIISPHPSFTKLDITKASFTNFFPEFSSMLCDYKRFYEQRIVFWSGYTARKENNEQQSQGESKEKHQLLELYRSFQTLWKAKNGDTKDIDPAVLAIVSPDNAIAKVDAIKAILPNVPPQFSSMLCDYDHFYEQCLAFWNECTARKEQLKNMLLAEVQGSRAGYVIPIDNVSKKLAEFRVSLFNLRNELSPAMKKAIAVEKIQARRLQLTPVLDIAIPTYSTQNVLPYPEMEDPYEAYMQPQQVMAIKRLFNAFYHLEGIVSQLEKLHKNSTKLVYVSHLLLCYEHLDGMKQSLLGLYDDPYWRLFARQLMDDVCAIYAQLRPELEDYQVGSEEITQIDAPVEYASFWYAMQAFTLLPGHIRAKESGQSLDAALQRKKQIQAKKNVTDIERIINSTDSYFKLFLEAPTMVRLFFDLRSRLTDFTETLHKTSIENLKNLDVEVFYRMLCEADDWERKMGLRPGSLSEPLDKILDKFYFGMIEALDLKSELEFSLLFNCERIIKRKARVFLTQEKIALQKTSVHEKDTKTLYSKLQQYATHPSEELGIEIYELYNKHSSVFQKERLLLRFKTETIKLNTALEKHTNAIAKNAALEQRMRHCIDNPGLNAEIDSLLNQYSSSAQEKNILESLLKQYENNQGDQKPLRDYMKKHGLQSGKSLREFSSLVAKYAQKVVKERRLKAIFEQSNSGGSSEIKLLAAKVLTDEQQDNRIEHYIQQLCANEIERLALNIVLRNYAKDSDNDAILNNYKTQHDIYGKKADVLHKLAAIYVSCEDRTCIFNRCLEKHQENSKQIESTKQSIIQIMEENTEKLQAEIASARKQGKILSYRNSDADRMTQIALNNILREKGQVTTPLDEEDDTLYFSTCLRYLSTDYFNEVSMYSNINYDIEQSNLADIVAQYGPQKANSPPSDSAALIKYLNGVFVHKASSAEMTMKIGQEQYDYLEEQEREKLKNEPAHRKGYILEKFDAITNGLIQRYVGLSGEINEEYQSDLKALLNKEKSNICKKVNNKNDIQSALNAAIKEQCQAYARKEYQNYAHLNAILVSLDRIEQYCARESRLIKSKRSVFESEKTLGVKTLVVTDLKKIAKNKDVPIAKRLEALKEKVEHLATSRALQDSVVHDKGWLWFKQWCYYLLSIVCLYTPAATANYTRLLHNTQKKTQNYTLPSRETFFSEKKSPSSVQENLVPLVQPAPAG